MFNSHVHTHFSPDSTEIPENMCHGAIERNMCGIAFTDHASLDSYILDNAYRNILNSSNEARRLNEKFPSLKVLSGVELSEVTRKPDYAARLIKAINPDTVLLSVHTTVINNKPVYFSKINFDSMKESEIYTLLKDYFRDVYNSCNKADFDILAHLTHPFYFINGKAHKNIPAYDFYGDIEKIFSLLIEKEKALEINTSKLNSDYNMLMPSHDLIRVYHEMGGSLISLGSDAHEKENLDLGFKETKEFLKAIGYNSYVYYEKRKPIAISL